MRRVWEFIALGICFLGIVYIDVSGFAAPCLLPLALSIGCVIAKCADNSKPLYQALRAVKPHAWLRVFLAGSVPWAFLGGFGLVLEIFGVGGGDPFSDIPNNVSSSSNTGVIQNMVFFSVILAMLASMIVVLMWFTRFLWFFWPLLTIAEIPFLEAFDQAINGSDVNGFVVWPFATCSFLLLYPVIPMPALLIPWLAITSSMMYVAYRDVWLSRSSNLPGTAELQPLMSKTK